MQIEKNPHENGRFTTLAIPHCLHSGATSTVAQLGAVLSSGARGYMGNS